MVRALTKGPGHHFFGFHDLCPWDASGRYMLAMETDFIDRPPKAEDGARICLIDLENDNKLEILAETRAWNFHQGCRAQWVSENQIIYNDREGNKFVSVILDIHSKRKESLPSPIYAVSPKGNFGLGLNFARLKRHGGYGYVGQVEEPQKDGIFKVDLKTKKIELIIPIEEGHILTHVVFNPSGTRICFVDKRRLPDGGFLQELKTANPDGSDLYTLPGHVTHYCWRNDEEILAFGKHSPSIMALRQTGMTKSPFLKPLLNIARMMRGSLKQKIAGQSYFLLKDKTQNVERIAVGTMTEDGHPQFSPNGRWVITDTYPDKNHERTLILYDWENKKRIDLEKFKSWPKGLPESWDVSEMRADLHPRWNRNGTQVCVDSVDDSGRQMYIVDVGGIVTNK